MQTYIPIEANNWNLKNIRFLSFYKNKFLKYQISKNLIILFIYLFILTENSVKFFLKKDSYVSYSKDENRNDSKFKKIRQSTLLQAYTG